MSTDEGPSGNQQRPMARARAAQRCAATSSGASQYAAIAERYRISTRQSFEAEYYRDVLGSWAGLFDQYGFVLDIGCGEGTFTGFLRDFFLSAGKVVGIDASEEMIRLARRDYPQVDFRVEDMCSLSLADATADLVFSRFAVHYSRNLEQTLAEIGRVTTTGGTFFLQDAHPFFSTFLKSSLDYERKEDVRFPAQCDDEISVVHPSFTFGEYVNACTETGWSIRSMLEVYGRHSSGMGVAPRRVPTSVCFLLDKK